MVSTETLFQNQEREASGDENVDWERRLAPTLMSHSYGLCTHHHPRPGSIPTWAMCTQPPALIPPESPSHPLSLLTRPPHGGMRTHGRRMQRAKFPNRLTTTAESRCPPLPGTSDASEISPSEGGGCWELGTGKRWRETHVASHTPAPGWRALAGAPQRFANCGGARRVGTYRIFHTCLRE